MNRQPGYYWVKADNKSEWQAALFMNERWHDVSFNGMMKLLDSDLFLINETRIPSPDDNIVGLKASVKGLIMPEFDAYQLLKKQFEEPPTTLTDGEITIHMFKSEEHCKNYRENNPPPTPNPSDGAII